MMKAYLETKEIKSLKDFNYKFNYLEPNLDISSDYDGLKVAYIDENRLSKKGTHFYIHGHPTWSYLWRHLLPFSINVGYRTIAIDLPGFGMSDKLIKENFFSFENYRNTIKNFIEKLNLNNITIFMHEWGGTLGLTLPMDYPELFQGSVCFSTYLGNISIEISESYNNWINTCKDTDELNVRALMARTNRILNLAECNAYEAPFYDKSYKLALNMLPSIFPISKNDQGYDICKKAEEWWKNNSLKNSLVLGGGRDPLVPIDKIKMLSKIIASDGLTHAIGNAGHFLPEWGMEFGEELFEQLQSAEND